jgi:hypothetical protein
MEVFQVDPRALRLPTTRMEGAEPAKLQRQIAKHGTSTEGMPPLFVVRGKDGELQIIDGVTRATRVAKLCPGQAVPVEVVENRPKMNLKKLPVVGDKLP